MLSLREDEMSKQVGCAKCGGQMEAGYVVAVTGDGQWVRPQSWAPGEPNFSIWRGYKRLKKQQVVPITTMRCPNCGYLEFYAIKQVS